MFCVCVKKMDISNLDADNHILSEDQRNILENLQDIVMDMVNEFISAVDSNDSGYNEVLNNKISELKELLVGDEIKLLRAENNKLKEEIEKKRNIQELIVGTALMMRRD